MCDVCLFVGLYVSKITGKQLRCCRETFSYDWQQHTGCVPLLILGRGPQHTANKRDKLLS